MKKDKRPLIKNRLFAQLLHTLVPHTIPLISINDAAQSKDAFFLDAREEAEYKVSHIKGAIHAGYKQFSITKLAAVSKQQKIIVYCSVGWRSAHIGQQLLSQGFTNVYNLYGGLFEWANCNQPLYCHGALTNAIHVYSKPWGVWVHKRLKKIC